MTCGLAATPTLAVREVTDRDEWNRLALAFPGADLRQGFEWAALRERDGWRPLRVAATRGDTASAAAVVLRRRIPLVGTILYVPRGPLWHGEDRHALARLVAAIRDTARPEGAVFLRVSPGVGDTHVARSLAALGFQPLREESTTWNTARVTQWLDLRPPEGDLLRRMRRRFRDHVAAAPRHGIVVEPTDREEDLRAFHALLVNTGRIKRIPVRDLAYLHAVVREFDGRGLILLVARVAGTVAGGALAIRFGDRVSMLHTSVRSSVRGGVRHALAPAMFWELIRRGKRAGCSVLDLGSSGVRLHPSAADSGYGVYRFKLGLGARLEAAPSYHDLVLRPARYRVLRVAETRVLPHAWRLAARATAWGASRPGRAAA